MLTTRDGAPIYVRDIAEVALGKELRTGAATHNSQEVVMGTVFMLIGANSRTVSQRSREDGRDQSHPARRGGSQHRL